MRKWMIVVAIAVATVGGITALATMPTKCPFVDSNTGLECLGFPMPDGVCVAGSKRRCNLNSGHRWVTKD